MANVIIFTDRAPQQYGFDPLAFGAAYYSPPAGAYKIASVLRQQGFSCVVIPNCLSLSLNGIKQIIHNNCQDLLWVGISTTFLNVKEANLDIYRSIWHESDDAIIGIESLFGYHQSYQGATEMAWESNEINAVADICASIRVPLLVGGAYVTAMRNVVLQNVKENVYIISGNAESVILKFTVAKNEDRAVEPPYVNDNRHYDDVLFKTSTIHWEASDLIDPNIWLPLEVSRGCAFNCAYCSYDRKSSADSYKDPVTLREELIRNYELFGVTKYMLLDDLYNDSRDKVRVLYDQVWSRLPFPIEWASYMRLDMIWADQESAEILKQSGARIGSFGIETLHDTAGRKVGKGLGRQRIIETLQMLKEIWRNDTLVHAFFLAGLPHEPLDSIIETMEWTRTTDLLFSYKWAPLWITPPEHFTMVSDLGINAISKENEKFGVTWPEPLIWQNSMGVRFDQVDYLASESMRQVPMGLRIGWSDYADLRTAGMTHDEIVGIRTGATDIKRLAESAKQVKLLIDARLQKSLQLVS